MKTILIIVSVLIISCEGVNQHTEKKFDLINTETDALQKVLITKFDSIKEPIIVDNYQNNILNFIANNIVHYDTSEFLSKTAAEASILNDTEYLWTKNISFKNKKPYLSEKGEKFYRRFELKSFEYGDSIICNKSFESWLMNFGTMAVPIKRGVFIRGFHTAPIFAIKTKVQITILFMRCEYISDEWDRLRLELLSIFRNDEKMDIISVGCGGPIEWKTKDSFEFDLNSPSGTTSL